MSNIQRTLSMDPGGLSSDLKTEMDRYMKKNQINNATIRAQFFPESFITNLFTEQNLTDYWKRYSLNHTEIKELVPYIHAHARKTFAILLRINKPEIIRELRQTYSRIDEHLFGRSIGRTTRSCCSEKKIEMIPALQDIAEEFYKEQWRFPPYLSSSDTLYLDPRYAMLPFKTTPKQRGAGGNGHVLEVEIDADYVRIPEDFVPGSKVACKRIRRDRDVEAWDPLIREVQVMRYRQHANITPIFASFIACLDDAELGSTEERLYLVLPLATMDMDSWIEEQPLQFQAFTDEQVEQHIWEAIWGLADGLTALHREIGSEVGYHGDIKPKNILLFEEPKGMIWKLADFGSANLKPSDKTSTTNIRGTEEWQPKEFHQRRGHTDTEGKMHGRSGDIWSLGCVYVCLALMLMFKWDSEGVKEFTKQRNGRPFSTVKEILIDEWLQKLRGKADTISDSQKYAFKALLSVIEDMLLNFEQRPFSWEINVDIYRITHPATSERELTNHLRNVVQRRVSEGESVSHNPVLRAKKQHREFQYLQVLWDAGWLDDCTTEQKAARMAKPSPSLPSLPMGEYTPSQRIETFKKIADAFDQYGSIVLYGLRGIGKTTIAKRYIAEVYEKELKTAKVFHVDAKTVRSLKQSYRKIADANHGEGHVRFKDKRLLDEVKKWLEIELSSDWLMLVDGLDSRHESDMIKTYLPSVSSRHKGRIIITTRNRLLSYGIVELNGICDIEVDCLAPDKALQLLREKINKNLLEDDNHNALELSSSLCCPEIIRDTARYLNKWEYTCKDLIDALESHGPSAIGGIRDDSDLASYFLTPTLVDHLRLNGSDEFGLLRTLSMFDNRAGLDFQLMTADSTASQEMQVKEHLNTLINCSLIWRRNRQWLGRNESGDSYHVKSVIQLSVLAWIHKNEGKKGCLMWFNKALSMMFRRYDRKKRHAIKHHTAVDIQTMATEFMPHFKHVLKYARMEFFRQEPDEPSFMFGDRTIQVITAFSHLLIEEDDDENAISMLELGQRYYKLDRIINRVSDDERERGLTFYFELNIELFKNQAVKARRTNSQIPNLKDQVQALHQSAIGIEGPKTPTWMGENRYRWQVLIALVYILRMNGEYHEAKTRCEALETVRVHSTPTGPSLPRNPSNTEGDALLTMRRAFAIMVSREEGKLFLAMALDWKSRNYMNYAEHYGTMARKALRDASIAVQHWFPGDRDLSEDISLDLLEVDAKIGHGLALDNAINDLEKRYSMICQTYGHNCMPAYNSEYKLSSAKWRRGGRHTDTARASLTKLLAIFEKELPPGHQRISECAAQLGNPPTDERENNASEDAISDIEPWPEVTKARIVYCLGAFVAVIALFYLRRSKR